jgi:hypothetical protein
MKSYPATAPAVAPTPSRTTTTNHSMLVHQHMQKTTTIALLEARVKWVHSVSCRLAATDPHLVLHHKGPAVLQKQYSYSATHHHMCQQTQAL